MASNSSSSLHYKFITEPDDDLLCMICNAVAKDPWQHGECGRLLCCKCLEEYDGNKPCPNCKMEQPQYFQDSRSKFYIKY